MSIFRKRFKSAKCKALLKLALIRINVVRKKHEIQLKHMRQDVSRFLQIGQYENAQTRVAHVIREQNVLDAFNILESFCEHVIKQMPILGAQKACPKDLLEAVSSLLFAGPRCAKLPELVKVRKIFAGKYGKDFVAATLEPNNSSGVSKVIIEKLSSSTSIKETQVKHIMQEIALEYGIKWNSTALDPELGGERGDCDGRNRSEDTITDSIPETVGPISGSESSLLTSIVQAKESFSLPPSSSCDDEDDAHFDGKNQFIVSVMRIRTLVASHCGSTSRDALQGRVISCDQHMQHIDRTFSQKQQEVVDASRDNFIEDFNILRTGTEGHILYRDVVSAAISADHAAAAARIAARLAMNALSQKALISDAETDTGEDDLICGPATRILQPNFQIPLQSRMCCPVKISVQIDPDPQQQAVVQSTSLSSNIFCDGSSSSYPIIDPGIKNKSSDGKMKINGCAELANEENPAWNDNAGTISSS